MQHLTSDVVLLDQLLAQYGPAARPIRELMRQAMGPMAERLWRESGTAGKDAPFTPTAASETAFTQIGELAPQTDAQRSLKARAIQVSTDLAQTRLALFVEASSSIPLPFLVVLVFWLAIIFASFSLFSHLNPTPRSRVGRICVVGLRRAVPDTRNELPLRRADADSERSTAPGAGATSTLGHISNLPYKAVIHAPRFMSTRPNLPR